MNGVTKPVFTQNTTSTDNTVSSVSPEVVSERRQRPESGAIWSKRSRTGSEYFSIRLELTKKQIETLQSRLSDLTEGEETVPVDFVAFPNSSQNSNPRRPSFRIYESIE